MKRAMLLFVLMLFAISLAACSGPAKKTTAVIKKITLSDNVIRAERKGKLRTFHVSDSTKFFNDDVEIKPNDLKEGDKVEFEYKIKSNKRFVSKVTVLERNKAAEAAKSGEMKPAEIKPGETQPGEVKPEAKPAPKPAGEGSNEEENEEDK